MNKQSFGYLLAALCLCVFTGCSETSSSEPESSAVTSTSQTTAATTATTVTTTGHTTTTAENTSTVTTTKQANPETTTAAETAAASFQAEHTVSFSPQDLDMFQLGADFSIDHNSYYFPEISDERDAYITYLLENESAVPPWPGSIAVDHQNNCVYVIGYYDWCTKDSQYWSDVAVFRIDEATKEITQCCRRNISKLGKKSAFSLLNVSGRTFMESSLGLYLVDGENHDFIQLDPDYDPAICSLFIVNDRLIMRKPTWDEEMYSVGYFAYDPESNSMFRTEMSADEIDKLTASSVHEDKNINITYEYAIPDNWYAKKNITVEW